MTKKPPERSRHPGSKASEVRRSDPFGGLALLAPTLLAIILSLPCLGFTFLWDDYNFLLNARSASLRDWLPQADDPFYRPISRALYFGIVSPFGTAGATLAHVMNLAYLAVAVTLLTILCTRLRNRRFGLVVGVLFAGMSAVPTLVGWASCSQDLLAINFVLLALLARSHGRDRLALLSFVAALFSKETSLTALPALVGWSWLVGEKPYRWKRDAALYGLLVLAWTAIHPAARVLLARGLAPGATGYVGLTDPQTWFRFAGRYLTVVTNLRLGSFQPTWSSSTTLYLGIAVIAGTLGFMGIANRWERDARHVAVMSDRHMVILGVLVSIPSLLMTSTIINSWAPYYAAFPMLGFAILGGLGLERVPRPALIAIIGVYLVLGIWTRGSAVDTTHITERELRPSSDAMKKIESGFLKTLPVMEHNTDLLLSVQVRGIPRVYAQMYVFQPPRLWYQDLSIRVLKPIRVHPSERPTVLAAVTSNLDVVFINPITLETRTASGAPPDYYSCERALRALAVGLAGTFPDRGARILMRIPNPTPEIQSAHVRTAAMLQLVAGHESLADSLIASAVPLLHQSTLSDLFVLLAEQPPGIVLDDDALRAFGIRQDDAQTIRELTGQLAGFGYADVSRRLASRLLTLQPGDPVGLRAMAITDSLLVERKKWPEEIL